jgi:hypothetical protein
MFLSLFLYRMEAELAILLPLQFTLSVKKQIKKKSYESNFV